ncbi:hypothetical protein Tco_1071172 [Tanacetum coccineum]|uniref:Uncharacterized protein n=1 Tax=Tanacetum coccineum TaxID=301880 RepID=A0ABQ5HNQ8_9ASTR
MNQEQAQQAARDAKLVPTDDRVKIGISNLKMDPTLIQKEDTYQVVLDIIKNSSWYNAFLNTADILGICPRVPDQEFTMTPSHDSLIDFLIDLGYKGSQRSEDVKSCPTQDDGVLGRLKFISKGELHQVYGKSIPDTLLTKEIKNSKAYNMYLGYSTSVIPPKKGRGKGAQGEKATVTQKKKSPKKKSSKKKISKKSSITADDNIILDPNQALNLGESMSKTNAKITEEERRVYKTYERLVTEFDMLIRRQPTGVIIRDTPNVPKKKAIDQSQKLKGMEILSDDAQLELDTLKVIKASKRDSRRQHQAGGSSEGAGIAPEVPDETKDKSADSSEGYGTSPKVPDESKGKSTVLDEDD